MRFKYLTKSYVEWLGLETRPYMSGSTTAFIPEDAPKPSSSILFRRAVEFEGGTYVESSDGKSFDLVGAQVAVP